MSRRNRHSRELLQQLVAIVRESPRRLSETEIRGLLADRTRRERLLDLAARHRIYGLAVSRLDAAASDLKDPSGAELHELLRRLRRRSTALALKAELAIALLERGGIWPVVLKGAAASLALYDDPLEREMRDLDLLVREEDVTRSQALLEGAGYHGPPDPAAVEGYRRMHFHLPLEDRDGHIVEVHWALTRPGKPFRLPGEEIRARAVELESSSPFRLRAPCLEHQLLHVVLQNVQEGFTHLGRTVEVDRIARRAATLDWGLVLDTARRGGLEAPLALSVQLARRILDTPAPAEALLPARTDRAARAHIAFLRPDDLLLRQKGAAELLELWLVRGARSRLRHLLSTLAEDTGDWYGRERRRVGWAERARRLARLAAAQASAYAGAAAMLVTPRGRGELRQWMLSRP